MKTANWMSTVLLAIPALLTAQGLVENFDNNNLAAGWGETGDYQLTETNGELRIDANKRSTWNAFTFSFTALDISANPYVSLKVRTEKDFNLGFSVWDNSSNYAYPSNMYQEIVVSNHDQEYTFDFSAIQGVDLTKIVMLNFVFNPGGAMRFEGTVFFDDLKIGDQASVAPFITTIPAQSHYINAPEQTVSFRGVLDPVSGANPIFITASSSDPALLPDPTVQYISGAETGSLTYRPAADRSGTATVTVTVTGNAPYAKAMIFDVRIEKNEPPDITSMEPFSIQSGMKTAVPLTGISDGNPNAEQAVQISASSSDTSIVPDPAVLYAPGDPGALLTLIPKPGQTGTATVTLVLKDDGGTADGGVDSLITDFQVTVFDNVNDPPSLHPIEDLSLLEGSGETAVTLNGISYGDWDLQQNLAITALSSNPSLIPDPVIEYVSPDSNAWLRLTPSPGRTGSATITVTVSDDGGTEGNNGDASVSRTFNVQVRTRPTIGFEQDFNDGVLPPEWPPDWDPGLGENCHRCSIEDGAMKIEIDKTRTGNIWAGLWFNISQELDLREYPYISITMKTSVPGKEMLIFLWDAFDHYNTGKTVRHRVTGEFTEYYFDFTGLNLQGDGTVVDFSRIKALLINFDPGQSPLFVGNFWFDDFRVGTYAHRAPVQPSVTLYPVPDFPVPKDAGAQNILLAGISDGTDGTHPVTLTATSSNKGVIPVPTIGPADNGNAWLTFTPAAGKTGNSTIKVTASAEGSKSVSRSFRIDVVEMSDASAVRVDIDLAATHQTIDGFGAFMGSGSGVIADRPLRLAADIGMTMARFGVIDVEFEPVNDNSDPDVSDWSRFDTDAVPLETMRLLRDNTDVEKFILTFWSPPAWMKRNKSLSAEGWSTDNKLEPFYYEEYAEHVAALIRMIQFETGIELYAVSLQNEPEFNEPYASCQINPNEMRDLIKVVGPRLEAEGLNTKIFWAEALPEQGKIHEYIRAVKNDPEAARYADIVAIHNYDADGIHVGGAGAQEWERIYGWAQTGEPKYPTWMTETSDTIKTWEASMDLGGAIFNALAYGNASAWLYWQFAEGDDPRARGLVLSNTPTTKFFISKQYYQFIRPGAMRVDASVTGGEIPSLAFKNEGESTVTVVLINSNAVPQIVRISGSELPAGLDMYTTSNFRNCEKMQTVSPGGLFILPASSITTLYGSYVTYVEKPDKGIEIPENFALFQNYPNPFNPATIVAFLVPKSSAVSLAVYDIMGREVCVLADAVFQAGRHTVQWDGLDHSGSRVSSGVYFIRIRADQYTAVKKTILLR